jgi:hypothetical protein
LVARRSNGSWVTTLYPLPERQCDEAMGGGGTGIHSQSLLRARLIYLGAADFPLPGLVAPVSVVPSTVPLAVPALGVIPDEKPVWGYAPAPGTLLALEALEFVRLAEPS